MKKRYVFRADASPEIGAGHVMRLYAIIEEMIAQDKEVLLVGRILGIPWLEQRVENLGSKLKRVEEDIFNPDPRSDVLIIDSYTLDPKNDFLIKDKWLKIAAFIETGTPKYRANLYIHCGTNNRIKSYYASENSKFIGGAKYLPIRKSIQGIKYKSRNIQLVSPIRILIVGGGTDPLDFVSSLSLELQEIEHEFEAILISNKANILKPLDRRFAQIAIGESFEKELVKTDLILTLAGTSSWEFLSSGFPLGIALGFDNQRDNFEFQKENGLAIDIGNFNKEKVFEFNKKNLLEIIESRELREKLSMRANASIDGMGAIRIADKLVKLSIN